MQEPFGTGEEKSAFDAENNLSFTINLITKKDEKNQKDNKYFVKSVSDHPDISLWRWCNNGRRNNTTRCGFDHGG